jgi:hypothetical protein
MSGGSRVVAGQLPPARLDRRGRHRPIRVEIVANRAGAKPPLGDRDDDQGDAQHGQLGRVPQAAGPTSLVRSAQRGHRT